jgi:L-lactate dehydrogenase complex protein LldG
MLEGIVGTFEVETPSSSRERLLESHVGLSSASMGIAEHGTIILPTGESPSAERSRFIALLPKIHVAVLKASTLYGTIHEALRAMGPLPPTVTFVTGPSRTADIEQELVLGVHGPHAQHVILLENE